MRKAPATPTSSILEDFVKDVQNGLLDQKEMKLIIGGTNTSHSRPLTGMYSG